MWGCVNNCEEVKSDNGSINIGNGMSSWPVQNIQNELPQ